MQKTVFATLTAGALVAPVLLMATSSADAATRHTLKVTGTSIAGHDAGADRFVGTSSLAGPRGGFRGYEAVRGRVGSAGTIHLTGALALRGGMLFYRGVVTDGRETGHVTGGTGVYHGAHGTVTGRVVDPEQGITKETFTWTR